MFTPTRLALATVLSLAFTPLAAQDFDESYAAYQAGDYATALQGLKPLAEQGSAGAQTILGVMYNQGQGVPLDNIEAGRWFLLAAQQGNALAQVAVASRYMAGKTQDYAEAVKWFRLAAQQGNATAQYQLGFYLRNGIGTLQDYAEAVKWFRLAAQQGNVMAQSQLGYSYQFEHGLPQDNTKAHMWLNIASANGDATAGSFRIELAAEMTPADISKAQEMARECMASSYQNCGE